jgi:cation:H+ antiporter
MNDHLLQLGCMLIVILISAELFTNALEHLGERLNISEGVTGSLFAALGTALPETMVPLLALFAGSENQTINQEIGTGAILGAPLMLSTLSTCLMAASILPSRGLNGRVCPELSGFRRDIRFFLLAFTLAALAMFVAEDQFYLKAAISTTLVLVYICYIILTLRASNALVDEGHNTEAHKKMFLSKTGLPTNYLTIMLQLTAGLILLIYGTKGFIKSIQGVSELLGVSALLLSLLIIPIATELPEKVNSILWIRRGKDTLAFGNITGAMVFQATLLPAIGILFTPWQARMEVFSVILITLLAGIWLRINAGSKGLVVWALMFNGILYAVYLVLALKY